MEPIQTERLLIRNFHRDDAADFLPIFIVPPRPCFFSMALKDMAAADDEVRNRADSDEYLAVCLKENGPTDRAMSLPCPRRIPARSAELQSPIRRPRGYATEAAQVSWSTFSTGARETAFSPMSKKTICPRGGFCERLGMRQEGVFIDFVSFEKR